MADDHGQDVVEIVSRSRGHDAEAAQLFAAADLELHPLDVFHVLERSHRPDEGSPRIAQRSRVHGDGSRAPAVGRLLVLAGRL